MREILFKAKRFDTGEWIEGYLVQQKNNLGGIHTCIFQNFEEENRWEMKRVDSNTVCQYTGLTDKNGRKIFEGDIVRSFLCIDDHNEPLYEYGKVIYIPERTAFEIWDDDNNWITTRVNLEVIGNILDNPELL